MDSSKDNDEKMSSIRYDLTQVLDSERKMTSKIDIILEKLEFINNEAKRIESESKERDLKIINEISRRDGAIFKTAFLITFPALLALTGSVVSWIAYFKVTG